MISKKELLVRDGNISQQAFAVDILAGSQFCRHDILPRIDHSANDSRRDLAADRDAMASSFGPQLDQLAWVGMGDRGSG